MVTCLNSDLPGGRSFGDKATKKMGMRGEKKQKNYLDIQRGKWHAHVRGGAKRDVEKKHNTASQTQKRTTGGANRAAPPVAPSDIFLQIRESSMIMVLLVRS